MESVATDSRQSSRKILKELEGHFQEMIRCYGQADQITQSHWMILMGLWDRGGRLTQTETKKLLDKLEGYKSDSKRRSIIRELISKEMLTKTRDEEDERINWIKLTEEANIRINKYLDEVNNSVRKHIPK